MQMLYEGHPYGHLAIGTETALKEMTVEDVQLWPQRIEAVTREQVVETVRLYLRPDRSVTGLLLPAA